MIRPQNVDPQSFAGTLRRNQFIAVLPRSSPSGLTDATYNLGDYIVFSGADVLATDSAGRSCTLRVPMCPVVTLGAVSADHTRTVTIDIDGYDHLGRKRKGKLINSISNGAQSCERTIAWSRIESAVISQMSASTRVRIGFMHGGWAHAAADDLATNLAASGLNQLRAGCRRIPIPFGCRSANDVVSIMPMGSTQQLGTSPINGVITYTATTAASSVAWTTPTVAAGDLVFTRSGWAGTATGALASNTVTVNAWRRRGATGTPAGPIQDQITIVRPLDRTGFLTALGGMQPGVQLIPSTLANADAVLNGLDVGASTYGFQSLISVEPQQDLFFIVTADPRLAS